MPNATYDFIGAATLSSSAATISVSSIPSTYTDIRVIFTVLAGAYPLLRYNNNTSPYWSTGYQGSGTSGNAITAMSNGNDFLYMNANGSSNASYPSVYVIDVFNYTVSEFKMALINGTNDITNTSVGLIQSERWTGIWNNTSTINSINIEAASGDFATGTNLQIYGIKKE
jgi:hypothetical protein